MKEAGAPITLEPTLLYTVLASKPIEEVFVKITLRRDLMLNAKFMKYKNWIENCLYKLVDTRGQSMDLYHAKDITL